MGTGWELCHVRTHFSEDCGRSFFFDTRDGLQQRVCFPERFRAQPESDLDVEGFYLPFEKIQVMQSVAQEKTVMVGNQTAPIWPRQLEIAPEIALRLREDFALTQVVLRDNIAAKNFVSPVPLALGSRTSRFLVYGPLNHWPRRK